MEKFGIVTKYGRNMPCRIEKEFRDGKGRDCRRIRYFDSSGYYNMVIDFFAEDVTPVDARPAPLS